MNSIEKITKEMGLEKDPIWKSILFFNKDNETFHEVGVEIKKRQKDWLIKKNIDPDVIKARIKLYHTLKEIYGVEDKRLIQGIPNQYFGISKDTGTVDNPLIQKMEEGCQAISNLISKSNLNHRERTTLLFIYVKLGKDGEQRLLQLLQRQPNYRYSITMSQINAYKKKPKFGVSCETMRRWGVCKNEWFKKCEEESNRFGKGGHK